MNTFFIENDYIKRQDKIQFENWKLLMAVKRYCLISAVIMTPTMWVKNDKTISVNFANVIAQTNKRMVNFQMLPSI